MSARLLRTAAPTLAGVAAFLIVAIVLRRDGYDFRIFYAAGQAVVHGRSPYPATAGQLRWRGFVYPLPCAWLFAPLTALPRATAYLAYTAICAAALAAGAVATGVRRSSVYSLSLRLGLRTSRTHARHCRTTPGAVSGTGLALA